MTDYWLKPKRKPGLDLIKRQYRSLTLSALVGRKEADNEKDNM